ncbi:hypothetical protein EVAR_12742_1 [Eumeta japonica]|uniref:Uncharacterized protein n=1 Tax=Eumeta variegata TaxID=151549 RepID=A0A4C1UNZ6_EUMVA|nr:hypothetical protein EVAR_12742_1 [Eumeta japonica]
MALANDGLIRQKRNGRIKGAEGPRRLASAAARKRVPTHNYAHCVPMSLREFQVCLALPRCSTCHLKALYGPYTSAQRQQELKLTLSFPNFIIIIIAQPSASRND